MVDAKKLEDEEDEGIKLLKSYQELLKEIRKAKHWKDAAYEKATACGGVSDGSFHSGSKSDRVGNGVAEMEKWSDIIHELNVRAESVAAQVTSVADEIDTVLADTLVMFYINDYTVETIAEEFGYSSRHVRRLLKKAKEEFSKKYFESRP